jgi:hypothetical protein
LLPFAVADRCCYVGWLRFVVVTHVVSYVVTVDLAIPLRTWLLPLRICYGTLPLPFNGPLRCAVAVVLVVLLLRCYVTLLVDCRCCGYGCLPLPFDTLPLPALPLRCLLPLR